MENCVTVRWVSHREGKIPTSFPQGGMRLMALMSLGPWGHGHGRSVGPAAAHPRARPHLGTAFPEPSLCSLGSSSGSFLIPLGLGLPSATGLGSSPSLSSQIWGPAPNYPSTFIRGWFVHISVCHCRAPDPLSQVPSPRSPLLPASCIPQGPACCHFSGVLGSEVLPAALCGV